MEITIVSNNLTCDFCESVFTKDKFRDKLREIMK